MKNLPSIDLLNKLPSIQKIRYYQGMYQTFCSLRLYLARYTCIFMLARYLETIIGSNRTKIGGQENWQYYNLVRKLIYSKIRLQNIAILILVFKCYNKFVTYLLRINLSYNPTKSSSYFLALLCISDI